MQDDWRHYVCNFMLENRQWLTEIIDEEWSSRDGFWSFMDNTFDEWYNRFACGEEDERYTAEIIKYMMQVEACMYEETDMCDQLAWDTMENVWLGDFIINTKKSA